MKQFSIKVQLIVKATDREQAESIVSARLNEWFVEDEQGNSNAEQGAQYNNGSLLYWTLTE